MTPVRRNGPRAGTASRRPGAAAGRLVPLLVCAALLAGGCATVPITERQQLSLVPESTLVEASREQYRQFLAEHDVVRSGPEAAMVEQVGGRIRAAVETFMRRQGQGQEVAGYSWEFSLIDSPEANAWAMPGGKVAVYTGILPITRSEAGLAVVVGHEIAHVVANHGTERMSQQLVAQMGGQALSAVLAGGNQASQELWAKIYGVGATVGVMLPYSRLQEKEADRLGLIFMAMAGYDPHVAVDVWQRMAQAKGGQGPPELLSTHPADRTRIENIRAQLHEALRYYQPR